MSPISESASGRAGTEQVYRELGAGACLNLKAAMVVLNANHFSSHWLMGVESLARVPFSYSRLAPETAAEFWLQLCPILFAPFKERELFLDVVPQNLGNDSQESWRHSESEE